MKHWVVWQLQTPKLCFLRFFGSSSVLALCFFGGPSMVLARLLQNAPKTLRGSKKKQSFDANTLEGPKKTKKQKKKKKKKKKKHKLLEHWVSAAQDSKNFGFLGPSVVLALLQNALKTLRCTKKTKVFFPHTLEGPEGPKKTTKKHKNTKFWSMG